MGRSGMCSLSPASCSVSGPDLAILEAGGVLRLTAGSVLGLLWLQTHFEACHWDQLAAGQARLAQASVERLGQDARAAGLVVARLVA